MTMRRDPVENLYQSLGVATKATPDEIKKAFRALALRWHPDKNSSPDARERFCRIYTAYEILGDPERRRAYDLDLERPPVSSESTSGLDPSREGLSRSVNEWIRKARAAGRRYADIPLTELWIDAFLSLRVFCLGDGLPSPRLLLASFVRMLSLSFMVTLFVWSDPLARLGIAEFERLRDAAFAPLLAMGAGAVIILKLVGMVAVCLAGLVAFIFVFSLLRIVLRGLRAVFVEGVRFFFLVDLEIAPLAVVLPMFALGYSIWREIFSRLTGLS